MSKLLGDWEDLDEIVNEVKMMVSVGLRAQHEIYEKMITEDAYFEIKSKVNYKYFEALCKAGFGRDEAIQIVAAAEGASGMSNSK